MSPRKLAVLRDGEGDRTLREHLIASAARLIAERGTAGLTVREIARAAKVADGVLYNHVADKEELLALALRAHVQAVMARAHDLPPAGRGTVEGNLRIHIVRGLDVLRRIMPAFAGVFGQPKVLRRFWELSATEGDGSGAPRTALREYLLDEQRLGRISASADVDAVTTLILGACHEATLPALFGGATGADATDPPEFVDGLVATVLHGIAPRDPG